MIDAVSADVLGDSSRFASRYACLANRVQERGLPMIDMAHEGDDGGARLELLWFSNNRRRRRDDYLFYLVNAGAFSRRSFSRTNPWFSAILAAISGSIVWLRLAKMLCVINSAMS